MFRKTIMVLSSVLACLLVSCAVLFAADQGVLTANTITYDSNTKIINAARNVLLTRGQSKVRGDAGQGSPEKSVFEISGNVSGLFPEYNVELKSANSLQWREKSGASSGGVVEARGSVHIIGTAAAGDFLKANYVRWESGTENYRARGGVDMRWEGRILKAAEAQRTGNTFLALKVTRYEDIAQKTVMSAERVDGKIRDNVVQDVVATGNVKMDYVDDNGFKTHLTGAKAVYSMIKDTVVVSGGAKAVRSDGKTVSSETMILHVESKNIEAVGSAKITFTLDDKAGEGKTEVAK